MGLAEEQVKMKQRWSQKARHPLTKRLVPQDYIAQEEAEEIAARPEMPCVHCTVNTVKANHLTGEYPLCTKCKMRDTSLRNKYGMSFRDREAMLFEQGKKCAVCCSILEKPYIDRCHNLGHVRGLLCHRCNQLLGLVKDDPGILLNAIKYLKTNIV